MLKPVSLKKISYLSGVLAIVMTVGLTFAGCNNAGPGGMSKADAAETVVTVNGLEVKKPEYQRVYDEFAQAFNLESMEPEAPQRKMVEDTIKQMTMNKLILNALVQHDASQMGIEITDNEVNEYKEKEIFGNPDTKAEYEAFLDQNLMSEAQFNDTLKESLLLNKFLEKKGGDEVKVSQEEIKEFYDANKEQFQLPERIKAKHILVKLIEPQFKKDQREKNPNISESELSEALEGERKQRKQEAENLFNKVKENPAQFEKLAEKHSDDKASAARGGDLGYMVEANIDPAFWQAAKKTPGNQLYPGVLHTQFGYHILHVEDHQPPQRQDFAEAQPMIEEHLEQQKKQMVLMRWANEQKASAEIEINPKYEVEPEEAAQQQPGAPAGQMQAPAAPAAAGQPAGQGADRQQ